MSEARKKFEDDLAEVDWRSLRIHLQRDALIVVSEQLDLVDVACRVAEDAKDEVSRWIEQGFLLKPTAEECEAWESQLDKPFRMLIVAPYILIQAVLHA